MRPARPAPLSRPGALLAALVVVVFGSRHGVVLHTLGQIPVHTTYYYFLCVTTLYVLTY